jgi:hypothetical protein
VFCKLDRPCFRFSEHYLVFKSCFTPISRQKTMADDGGLAAKRKLLSLKAKRPSATSQAIVGRELGIGSSVSLVSVEPAAVATIAAPSASDLPGASPLRWLSADYPQNYPALPLLPTLRPPPSVNAAWTSLRDL